MWAWWLPSGITHDEHNTPSEKVSAYGNGHRLPQAYMGRVEAGVRSARRGCGARRRATHPLLCPPHKDGHDNRISSIGFALILMSAVADPPGSWRWGTAGHGHANLYMNTRNDSMSTRSMYQYPTLLSQLGAVADHLEAGTGGRQDAPAGLAASRHLSGVAPRRAGAVGAAAARVAWQWQCGGRGHAGGGRACRRLHLPGAPPRLPVRRRCSVLILHLDSCYDPILLRRGFCRHRSHQTTGVQRSHTLPRLDGLVARCGALAHFADIERQEITISFSHQPVAAAAQTSALFPSKPSSRACRSYLPQARQVCAHGALCAARDARRPSLSPLPASMSNQAPFIALPQVCQVRAQRTLRAARDARRPCVSSLPGAAQCHQGRGCGECGGQQRGSSAGGGGSCGRKQRSGSRKQRRGGPAAVHQRRVRRAGRGAAGGRAASTAAGALHRDGEIILIN